MMNSEFASSWLSITNSVVLGGAAAALLLAHLWRRHRDRRASSTSKNGPPPWPRVPGALPIVGNDIGGVENLTARIEEWADEYGSKGCCGFYEFNLFGRAFVVPCNEANAALLEKERPFNFVRTTKLVEAVKSVGGDGVFAAEGDAWRRDRRVVGPALNRKNVRDYVGAVRVVTGRLLAKWAEESAGGGSAVTINADILSCNIDIISLVAFGRDTDSLRGSDSIMADDLLRLFRAIQLRILSPLPYWRMLPFGLGQFLDGAGWARRRLLGSFAALVDDEEEDVSSNSVSGGSNNRTTFLSKIIALSKSDSASMSRSRLVGNLLTMFAAGSETTHVTLCSALWEIATDRTGLQDELAEEALSVDGFDDAALDDLLDGLPRLRSVIYETLRIRGPSPILGVQNAREHEIMGHKLPPGTNFFIPMRYISTLDGDGGNKTPLGPMNAPRAEYCPRRWLSFEKGGGGGVSVIAPSYRSGFRAFGTGMRVCPGRDLAEAEVMVMAASILRRFEVSLKEDHPPMRLVTKFSESPDIDICLVLKARKGQ